MKKSLLFLAVAALVLGAWWWFRQPAAAGTDAAPAARVELTALHTQVIRQTLEAFGVVAAAPSGEQAVSAAFDCLVQRVDAVPGAHVAAGDVLLTVVPSPEARVQFDAARSAGEFARQALAATQERYDLKLANRQELLAAQQAELDARQKLASLEQRGLGGDGRIVAPAAGVVGKLELAPGALVTAGAVLVTITADAGLEARLGLEAAEAQQVVAGQPVTLTSTNRPGAGTVASVVRVAGRALDPATGAAEVRVPVPAGAVLLPGEHVKAGIELNRKTALVAPRSAVLPADDKLVLFTVKNGKAVRHEVTTGISDGDLVEVSGPGLQDGDQAVSLGNYELTDGMAVQPPAAENREPEAAGRGQETKP